MIEEISAERFQPRHSKTKQKKSFQNLSLYSLERRLT